jgi:hypothetical protein
MLPGILGVLGIDSRSIDARDVGVLVALSNFLGCRRALRLEESMESRNDCSKPWVGPGCSSFGRDMLAFCDHSLEVRN